jgi:hypothetical protein
LEEIGAEVEDGLWMVVEGLLEVAVLWNHTSWWFLVVAVGLVSRSVGDIMLSDKSGTQRWMKT